MISRRTAFVVIAFLSIVAVLQNCYYWLHLPDRVAIHFNASGQPDNWATRDVATIIMLGLQLGFPMFMMVLTPMASKLPNSMINVPHREYWLAPERRAYTLEEMSKFMSIVAIAGACFFIGINHVTYIANRDKIPLPMLPFGIMLITFLAIVFSFTGKLVRQFNRIPKDTP